MALIEIPLNSYRYHFRRLTWPEETSLQFPPREDQRKIFLSHAMVDVSGLPVTQPQALAILKQLPDAIFWRIWLLYRSDLEPDRYYTSGGLYEAADPMTYRKQIHDDQQTRENLADSASAALASKYGQAGLDEAESICRQIVRVAGPRASQLPARGLRMAITRGMDLLELFKDGRRKAVQSPDKHRGRRVHRPGRALED